MWACDEVSTYGQIADVLAIDKHKKQIIEYEFKVSSQDLKYAEKKKDKYQQQWKCVRGHRVKTEYQQPHRFYFVVPQKLWDKERAYLESQSCGVIMYFDGLTFLTVKKCTTRKKNLQKYEVAMRSLMSRVTSAYVGLLGDIECRDSLI